MRNAFKAKIQGMGEGYWIMFFLFKRKGEGYGERRSIDDLLVVNFDNIASSKIEKNYFISNFMSLHEKINQTSNDELSFFGRKFSHICTQLSSSRFLQFGQFRTQTGL
jgi:hypothetical protein